MKNKILSIGLVLLISISALAGISMISSAQTATANNALSITGVAWYSQNSTMQAVPGIDDIPLFVSFMNEGAFPGNITMLNVSMNLTTSAGSPFSYSYINGPNAEFSQHFNITALPIGDSATIVQMVNISKYASTGIYAEKLSYVFYSGAQEYAGNATFPVPLLGTINIVSPNAFFGTSSNELVGGPSLNNVPVTVYLENTGNSPATNITASYTPSGSFSGQSQTTYISAIPSYGAVPVTFLVNVSQSSGTGLLSQVMNVTYNGLSHNVTFKLPVIGSSNVSVVNYYTNPPVIYQDQKFVQLTVFTANSGTSFAKDTNAYVTSAAFASLTGQYNLSYYPSGSMLNFTFILNAMNVTGSAPVVFHLGNLQYTIPLYLHNYGTLQITSSIPTMHPGSSKSVMEFNITNTANVTMMDINIHLLTPSVVSIHVSSSNPLGALTANNVTFSELKPGQTITVTFVVDTESNANTGTYPAQLFMSWRLNDTQSIFYHTYNFNEKITPTAIQSLTSSFTLTPINELFLAIVIILIVTVIVLAVRGRSKKKIEKPEEPKTEQPRSLPHKDIERKNEQPSRTGNGEAQENRR